jgi:hypothetical protein
LTPFVVVVWADDGLATNDGATLHQEENNDDVGNASL